MRLIVAQWISEEPSQFYRIHWWYFCCLIVFIQIKVITQNYIQSPQINLIRIKNSDENWFVNPNSRKTFLCGILTFVNPAKIDFGFDMLTRKIRNRSHTLIIWYYLSAVPPEFLFCIYTEHIRAPPYKEFQWPWITGWLFISMRCLFKPINVTVRLQKLSSRLVPIIRSLT